MGLLILLLLKLFFIVLYFIYIHFYHYSNTIYNTFNISKKYKCKIIPSFMRNQATLLSQNYSQFYKLLFLQN